MKREAKCELVPKMAKLRINLPDCPPPMAVPTDPRAAWGNGYRAAANACEDVLNGILPYMSQTLKAKLINRRGLTIEVVQDRTQVIVQNGKIKPNLPCNHGDIYVEPMDKPGAYICTLCGNVGYL